MLDLNSLTTRKGAKIALHLEDESAIAELELKWAQSGLQEKLRRIIDRRNADTGPSTSVHLLINKNLDTVGVLTDKEFAEWEKNPNWDHHLRSRKDNPLAAAILAGSVEDPISAILLAAMLSNHEPKPDQFTGATREQMVNIIENPTAEKVSLKAAKDKNCNLCPVLTGMCLERESSFDITAFEAAIAAYQP